MFRLRHAFALVLGAVLCASVPAAAQTVDEVVAKNLLAKGGVDLLKATTSVKITGVMKQPNGEMKMIVWAKRPNLKRVEAEMVGKEKFAGQKMVQAFDGTTAWVMFGGMPPQSMPPGPQLEAAKQQAEFDSVFLDYKEQGRKIELVGKGKLEGGEVYHVTVASKDGQTKHYYIDAETGLERKAVSTVRGPDGSLAQIEERFSDYRSVDGRMMPFSIEQIANGKPIAQTRVESVEFNVAIDEKLFQMPPRVR